MATPELVGSSDRDLPSPAASAGPADGQPAETGSSRATDSWCSFGRADLIFIGLVILMLPFAGTGMLDDPGLGWHLRVADQMWETRGFIYNEPFCFTTEGLAAPTKSWLGDIALRLAYGWGGLNGVAILTILVLATAFRCLYTRMLADGVPGLAATGWTLLAAVGTLPSWVARPNVFTVLGVVLVAGICEEFHAGRIRARTTLWLIPLMLLWTNLHGGYLAGVIVLGVTWLVELAIALLAWDRQARLAARRRLGWWTLLAVPIFLATLVNPDGIRLHTWCLAMLNDPYIQLHSTTEWRSPDLAAPGWQAVQLVVLLFPALAASSRYRLSLLSIALAIAWLRFGLTGARYSALFVVVVIPSLALLSCQLPWLQELGARLASRLPEATPRQLAAAPLERGKLFSLAFAALVLVVSPWLGNVGHHDTRHMPVAGLDALLEQYQGERVFHSPNWGGYLTLHGWNLEPRLKTFLDDRTDIHPPRYYNDGLKLLGAEGDWEGTLKRYGIDLLCIPAGSPLDLQAAKSPSWKETYRDGDVAIFRRTGQGVTGGS